MVNMGFNRLTEKNIQVPGLKSWIILLIIPVICYSIYLYTDIIETTSNSLKIWYLIFGDGKLSDFYTYRYPLLENAPQAGYDFFIYIIFAIWNIPLFIFEKITSVSYTNYYITVLYAKSIIILFLVLTAIQVYKLTMLISGDKTKASWSVFSFVFSVSVFQTIGIIGGYDIISVFFTLCGIVAYFQNRDKHFLLYFSFAIACKLFAVWIFVPLVLLKYKKIPNIILSALAGIQMILIPKILFAISGFIHNIFADSVQGEVAGVDISAANIPQTGISTVEEGIAQVDAGTQLSQIVSISHSNIVSDFIWGGEAPITAPVVPAFFFFTFILWVWCWFRKEKLSKYQTIFVVLLGMSIFILTCNTYPYWFILIAPYMAILVCTSWENIPIKVFLEICSGVSYILVKVIRSPQCYHYNLIVNMLHNEASRDEYFYYGLYTYLSKVCSMIGLDVDRNLRMLATSIFAASSVMFLWYVRKDKSGETNFQSQDIKYFYWKAYCCIAVSLIPFLGVTIRIIL